MREERIFSDIVLNHYVKRINNIKNQDELHDIVDIIWKQWYIICYEQISKLTDNELIWKEKK